MPSDTEQLRIRQVEEHVRMENNHDLEGIMETFGESVRYEDEAWETEYHNRDGVETYYDELLRALPDLHIHVNNRHVTEEHVVLEVEITGTHEGFWRGLPPTGRSVRFPLCAIYSFDEKHKLTGERIYYDRATVLRQLGMFHEPISVRGRILAPFLHPFTLLKAAARFLYRIIFKQDPTP